MTPSHAPPLPRYTVRNRYVLVADLMTVSGALFLAYSLRFERLVWQDIHTQTFGLYLLACTPMRLVAWYLLGMYRRLWEFAGSQEFERLLLGAFFSICLGFLFGAWLLPAIGILPIRVPFSVLAVEGALITAGLFGIRLFPRVLRHRLVNEPQDPTRILVAGAGAAGEMLVRELRINPRLRLAAVGFVDDDPRKLNQTMYGLRVLGRTDQIAELRTRYEFDEVIIAMPSTPGAAIRAVIRTAAKAGIPARTVPGVSEILSGQVSVSALRPVQIEDLLRREPVHTDLHRVAAHLKGRTVIVTGAGGSIGSELCRQIAQFQPARLVLLGHGENSVFGIHRELQERGGQTELIPLIVDIRDRRRMIKLFRDHQPDTVFHAAAHKHVPLMERNVAEAVINNIDGTQNVIDSVLATACQHLVLISTDKAVHPANVMGATKRVAEQLVQRAAVSYGRNFISVRFGNVLGSRGSVVPIFLRQIEAGGPVTVTHPEMRRYFMTIPESVQLVLQAVVLGQGGEVFVLDMGEPIKIVDLAGDLIRLSGLEVGRDIEIEFTGARAGEKLFEELFFGAEVAVPTEHPKVLRARHLTPPTDLVEIAYQVVQLAQEQGDPDTIRRLLQLLVPDYQPKTADAGRARGPWVSGSPAPR